MDTRYAAVLLTKQIERSGKIYYCPVKINRKVVDSFFSKQASGNLPLIEA